MPIPEFDHNHVIRPFLEDPTAMADISPYLCSTVELCEHFATSPERIQILKNFLEFRRLLTQHGIKIGFQWLNGSFLENIEVSEKRAPNDLDVVTFFGGLSTLKLRNLIHQFPAFTFADKSKEQFQLDHYHVDYDNIERPQLVFFTTYWYQLFSHNRNNIWKGMLQVSLNTELDDQIALEALNAKKP